MREEIKEGRKKRERDKNTEKNVTEGARKHKKGREKEMIKHKRRAKERERNCVRKTEKLMRTKEKERKTGILDI